MDGQLDRQTERQTDRQTGRQAYMTKLIVSFRNFANAPKNYTKCLFLELENENC